MLTAKGGPLQEQFDTWVNEFFAAWPGSIPEHRRANPFHEIAASLESNSLLPDQSAILLTAHTGTEETAVADTWRTWQTFVESGKNDLTGLKRAAKDHFRRPEPFILLCCGALLAGNRGVAYRAVERVMRLDPKYTVVREKLFSRFARRARPALPFLSRSNPVNVWIGRIRQWWQTRRALD